MKRCRRELFILCFMMAAVVFSACGSDLWIRLTKTDGGEPIKVASDQNIFPVYKKDNGNYVQYAVEITSDCLIGEIFPYWVLEKGGTETLKEYEIILGYGVEELHISQDATTATFHIVQLPEKTITVVRTQYVDGEDVDRCYFEPQAEISKKQAVISHAVLDNKDNEVKAIELFGLILPGRITEVTERINR